MKIDLIAATQYLRGSGAPEELVEYAGRICWQTEPRGDPLGFIRKLVRRGHTSVIEHARFIFLTKGASDGDLLTLYQTSVGTSVTRRLDETALVGCNARSIRDMLQETAAPLVRGLGEAVIDTHPVFVDDLVQGAVGREQNITFPPDHTFRPLPGIELIGTTLSEELTPWELAYHGALAWDVSNISRACSHQLVRHRVFSFSQESQRYVDMSDPTWVVPPAIAANEAALKVWARTTRGVAKAYGLLRQLGVKKEDARFLLPNAAATRLVATAPLWGLCNFFELRCEKHAQWEIQEVANKMLKLAYEAAPAVFADLHKQFIGEAEQNIQ